MKKIMAKIIPRIIPELILLFTRMLPLAVLVSIIFIIGKIINRINVIFFILIILNYKIKRSYCITPPYFINYRFTKGILAEVNKNNGIEKNS